MVMHQQPFNNIGNMFINQAPLFNALEVLLPRGIFKISALNIASTILAGIGNLPLRVAYYWFILNILVLKRSLV